MANYKIEKDSTAQFIKFCLVGAFNTLVSLSIIFSLKYFLSTPDPLANFIGYVIGLGVSYFLNGSYTFKTNSLGVSVAIRFSIVFFFAYTANLSATILAIKSELFNSYASHLVGVPVYTLVSFLGSKYFVFKEESNA